MIPTEKIHEILKDYKKPKIATVTSHSAIQIFLGAHQEKLDTIAIGPSNKKKYYDAFPLARPKEFIEVDEYRDVLNKDIQDILIEKNAILIPTGSFVEYIKAENIEKELYVPEFGNRAVLAWESDKKKKQRYWLENQAGIKMPAEFKPDEIDRKCIVKLGGAKGGAGFFIVSSEDEFYKEMRKGRLSEDDITIQEFIDGNRYYPSYFYSPLAKDDPDAPGLNAGVSGQQFGKVELICVDRRDEVDLVVVGNIELVYRESLLPKVLESGRRVVDASLRLFPPGMIGPFCIETIITKKQEIYAFEISARIVAGTNVTSGGSFYTPYSYEEPMSMGRRIAREIKRAWQESKLDKIIS